MEPNSLPDPFGRQAERDHMVKRQIQARGVRSARVLAAMRRVPRHSFVPPREQACAYDDEALGLGLGLTISQPYIVGLMTELLELQPGQKVLEIGTGSGYQAAILAEMGAQVYSLEIVAPMAELAQATLATLGYVQRVSLRMGDGTLGWPEAAPFDAILITCAVRELPVILAEQLAVRGRVVFPQGEPHGVQTLMIGTKRTNGALELIPSINVVFVPLTGPHGFQENP